MYITSLRSIWLCFVSLLMLLPLSQLHAQGRSVQFSVYEYPPLYHTSTDGEFSGTLGETIKMICKQSQLDCMPNMMPITRAYDQAVNGQSDMTISATHPRFAHCCEPSKWSYPWSAGFFSMLPAEQVPSSEEEMIGRSMIVVRGWRSHYRFMPNFDKMVADKEISVQYANSNYSAIQMLKSGRADLLWGSVDYLWYLDKLNLSDSFNYTELLRIPLVLWVNKERPLVLEKLNEGYHQLQQANLLDEQNLLRSDILHNYYQDAPLKKTQ